MPDKVFAVEIVGFIQTYMRPQLNFVNGQMTKKIAKGTYVSSKAHKAFRNLADSGTKRYQREYRMGTKGYAVDVATRNLVATKLLKEFEESMPTRNPSKARGRGKWFKALAARILPNGAVQVRVPRGAKSRNKNPSKIGSSSVYCYGCGKTFKTRASFDKHEHPVGFRRSRKGLLRFRVK